MVQNKYVRLRESVDSFLKGQQEDAFNIKALVHAFVVDDFGHAYKRLSMLSKEAHNAVPRSIVKEIINKYNAINSKRNH